jgi:hypothetical protein
MQVLENLNIVELGCCCIGVAMQVIALYLRKRPIKEILAVSLWVLPATLLAATAFTRFLSWDESYIFYDIVNFRTSRLPQWELGAFRTSITLFGPVFGAVQTALPLTKDVVLVLVKAVHWLSGVAVITLMTDQVHRYFFPEVHKSVFHGIVYNAIMLLPVTGLALKTLNYDLFSMLLGVLGCVWVTAGLYPVRKKLLAAGLIALTLAAHEKLIGSPLLWIALVASTVRLARTSKLPLKKIPLQIVYSAFTVTFLSVATAAVSFAVVYGTHGPHGPVFNADQMFTGWMSCLWPFARLFGVAISPSMVHQSLLHELPGIIVRMLIVSLSVGTLSMLVWTADRLLKKVNRFRSRLRMATAMVGYLPLVLLTAVTVTGIIAQYCLKVYIWPLIPVSPGNYLPRMTFNGIAHHFGAGSLLTHTLASTAWSCAVLVNALPTVLLAGLFAACIFRLRIPDGRLSNRIVRVDMLAIFFLSAAPVYGALQIPLYPRYLNLFLLGILVTVLPGLLFAPLHRYARRMIGIAGAGLFLVGAELIPFQPLGAAFRPIWSNYSKSLNGNPGFGLVTPWYPGWGEELYCAYQKIKKLPDRPHGIITLFYNFPAALIQPPADVRLSAMPRGHGRIPYGYGGNDYYILSRNGISTYPYIQFPDRVKPLFTLADRGFVKAWVFRGIDLKAAGFLFDK